MKKKIYLAMLAVCFALTASACGDGGAAMQRCALMRY